MHIGSRPLSMEYKEFL